MAIKQPIGAMLDKLKVVGSSDPPGKISVPIKDIWVYPLSQLPPPEVVAYKSKNFRTLMKK